MFRHLFKSKIHRVQTEPKHGVAVQAREAR